MARKRILDLLNKESDAESVRECSDGIAAISKGPIDLFFLDVQMLEMDGFSVVAKIPPEKMPAIIFVTAYDQYAIKAFEVHALDYLLKPFDDERFGQALDRVNGFG